MLIPETARSGMAVAARHAANETAASRMDAAGTVTGCKVSVTAVLYPQEASWERRAVRWMERRASGQINNRITGKEVGCLSPVPVARYRYLSFAV